MCIELDVYALVFDIYCSAKVLNEHQNRNTCNRFGCSPYRRVWGFLLCIWKCTRGYLHLSKKTMDDFDYPFVHEIHYIHILTNLFRVGSFRKLVEILEAAIRDNGIDYVIPSKRSQLHYFVVKEVFHDLSKYPVKELKAEMKKSKRKKLLRDYYLEYFEEEFIQLTQSLASEEKIFRAEMEYYLSQYGFYKDGDGMILSDDPGIFLSVEAEIDEKKRIIDFSAELGNPYFAETGECGEEYIALVETIGEKFTQIMGEEPCISSSEEYCECPDISYTFSFQCTPNIEKIEQFLNAIEEVESVLCELGETID